MCFTDNVLVHGASIFLGQGTREAHHATFLQDTAKDDVLKHDMLAGYHKPQIRQDTTGTDARTVAYAAILVVHEFAVGYFLIGCINRRWFR